MSASSVLSLVSSSWFADVGDATLSRHVNPDSFSTNDVEELDKIISIDADSVNQYDWIVQFNTASLDGVASVAETASLLVGQGMQFDVLRGLGLAGQVVVRSYGSSLTEVSDWFSSSTCVANYELDLCYQFQTTPNDSSYSNLWGMDNAGDHDIDAEAAWNISTGSSSIVVGVIDTGVDYTHPDLAANIWTNPGETAGNGIDDDGNGFVDDVHGYDFYNNDSDPMDDNNHGTHCAGTIAGVGNNGQGVVGVNWNSSIMALKFLGADGSGSLSDAVMAVNYATMMRNSYDVNIRVTSNSWGGGGYSTSMANAITAHNAAGILFVAAAGNDGTNNDVAPHFPSSYTQAGVIAVAATDSNDNLASFSNYGAQSVDLAAPGVSIYSTVAGGGYAYYSGTSMATPHVAGVAALAWSVDSDATVLDVREAILQGVDSVASLSGKMTTGGRLNAFNTLELLDTSGPQTPYMSDLSASPNPAGVGETVTLTAAGITDSDGSVTAVSFYRDDNGNGQFDETDLLIGTDTTIVNSQATTTLNTSGLSAGNHLLFARALDNDSQWSRAYSATLTLTSSDQHGDTSATATLIAVGSSTNGEIQTATDVDWFKFQASQDWVYLLDTDLLTLSDSVLYLYDQNGTTLLDSSDDVSWPSDASSAIAWQAPSDGTYFVKVASYDTETGTYRLNLLGNNKLSAVPESLGTLDFEQVSGLDLTSGGISYGLEASRDGYLTVEALYDGNPADVDVTLYDINFNELATSSAVSGGQRIDWQASAGDIFFVDISGSVDDVDLNLANLVRESGSRVYAYGTSGDDSFTFAAAATHQITVNGVAYEFNSASFDQIQFHGQGGNDTALLTGTSGDDTASLSPTFGTLSGTGYQVFSADIDNLTVRGGGGNDTALLYDSAGNDAFTATPEYAVISGSGYSNRVESFATVRAYSLAGGTDTATFYDSAGDDALTATSTFIEVYGDGFYNYAQGFHDTYTYATAGGTDRAYLYDSAGDDSFDAVSSIYCMMRGANYLNYVQGFRFTFTYATAGGTDRAYLFDSAGNDYLKTTSTYSVLYGDNFNNYTNGFRYTYSYATAGGTDKAYYYDSTGDDVLYLTSTYAVMSSDNFSNYAKGFGYNYAFATAGGSDIAHLYDSAGNDSFDSGGTYGVMFGDNFINYAEGFRYTNAYSTAGGTDYSFFYDTVGDDTFVGTTAYASMSGDSFDIRASGFRRSHTFSRHGGVDKAYIYDSPDNDAFDSSSVFSLMYNSNYFMYAAGYSYSYGFSTAGGVDRAYHFDSAGDDTFVATSTYSMMTSDDSYRYAGGFRYNYAYAWHGGVDTAYLYDSAGDDTFAGSAAYSCMYNNSFFNYAGGFEDNYAYSSAGGYDRAYFYDSAANDRFSAAADLAMFDYAASDVNAIGFNWVRASATAGGTNTRETGAVDFVLEYMGTWTGA